MQELEELNKDKEQLQQELSGLDAPVEQVQACAGGRLVWGGSPAAQGPSAFSHTPSPPQSGFPLGGRCPQWRQNELWQEMPVSLEIKIYYR